MSLNIVTATNHKGMRCALCRGRLVSVCNATIYTSPSAARRSMESASKRYDRVKVTITDWKIEPFNGVRT